MISISNHTSSEKDFFKKLEARITPLLFSFYYRKHLRSMKRTLWLSRIPFFKNSGKYLLFLQKVMAIHLSKFQEAKNEGERMLALEQNIDKRELLVKRIGENKELARILQTIADGIAWRSMGYQRSLMRLFSENNSPGHIDKELSIITALRSSGIIIVNDLTRFCRIADFTRILPDGRIIFYEAKTKVGRGKTVLKDMGDILKKVQGPGTPKLSRQDRRHLIVQKAIINKEIEVPIFREGVVEKSLEVQIVDIYIPIKTYFDNLKPAIKTAKKNLWGYSALEPGYFLSVKAYDALKTMTKAPKEQIEKNGKSIKLMCPNGSRIPLTISLCLILIFHL